MNAARFCSWHQNLVLSLLSQVLALFTAHRDFSNYAKGNINTQFCDFFSQLCFPHFTKRH